MKKEAMISQQLLMDVQECIELICMKLESKPSIRVSIPLNIDLKSLIEKQVVIVTELFEKFKIEPKFGYYYVKPGICVKINTGMAGVNTKALQLLYSDIIQQFILPDEGERFCGECVAAKYDHRVVMVPHAYTKVGSQEGEGIPVYRFQCTNCDSWYGGFVL